MMIRPFVPTSRPKKSPVTCLLSVTSSSPTSLVIVETFLANLHSVYMGHFLPDFLEEDSGSKSTTPMLVDHETSEAGEGVGAEKVRVPSAHSTHSSVPHGTEGARRSSQLITQRSRSQEEEETQKFLLPS